METRPARLRLKTRRAMGRKILVALDGSRFEIEALIEHTLKVLYRQPEDVIFLFRIQTSHQRRYDDALLTIAAEKLRKAGVAHVEILVHAKDDMRSRDIALTLLEHAESIHPCVLVLGRNDIRRSRVALDDDASSILLHRRAHRDVAIMVVNFAPEVTDRSSASETELGGVKSINQS
jgi:tRNA threonylcarbamoyladenosine modification (KEOPS) complex  Pcc1 subunit